MKNPPHPGKVVRVSCLEPLGLNVTEGARDQNKRLSVNDLYHPLRGNIAVDPGRRMTRFVFDTNVIVSALLFNDSAPGRAATDYFPSLVWSYPNAPPAP